MPADRPTILIVDDVASNLALMKAILSELDCELVTATEGGKALALASTRHPDLIVLDIMMPGMTGFDVLQRLKADAKTANIPVIVVTAYDDLSFMVKTREIGVDAILTKPVNGAELLGLARKMLGMLDEDEAAKQPANDTGRPRRRSSDGV